MRADHSLLYVMQRHADRLQAPGMTPEVAEHGWHNAAACCESSDLRTDSQVCRRLFANAMSNPLCVSHHPHTPPPCLSLRSLP